MLVLDLSPVVSLFTYLEEDLLEGLQMQELDMGLIRKLADH